MAPLTETPRPLPTDARRQLKRLTTACQAHFGQRLVGLYLHGSAADGTWRASVSDLDLLTVLSGWQVADRSVLGQLCLDLSQHPADFELHILTQRDLMPWQHPAPYRFHYSEAWRPRISAGDPAPGADTGRAVLDRDLAVHLTMARRHGVLLSGHPAASTLPEVPRLHFLDGVFSDLAAAAVLAPGEGYEVLNLCRTWAYLSGGDLLSKEAGGRWAVSRLPASEAATVYQALLAHRDGQSEEPRQVAACRRLIWPLLWRAALPAERAVIRRWWPAGVSEPRFG